MFGNVSGIDMGILSDGTAFLSGRSLGDLCGIKNSSISEASTDWLLPETERKTGLAKWLAASPQNLKRESLFVQVAVKGGKGVASRVNAYPEDVCILILDYYAHELNRPHALSKFRLLARSSIRAFVYHALGYDPSKRVPASWRQFHARMMLVSAPPGYFSVFEEGAKLIMAAIRAGLRCDSQTVPDISIGVTWSAYWKKQKLAEVYGEHSTYEHNYPDDFPQSASNPQEINVYPVKAVGDFRVWMEKTYIPQKFPNYLKSKIAQGMIPVCAAELLLEAVDTAKLAPPLRALKAGKP